MIKEDGQVGKKKTEKGEEPRRKRGRPSKSKYDEEIHIPATPDELAIAIMTTTPKELKEWEKRQGNK